jgi:hypothetical protein
MMLREICCDTCPYTPTCEEQNDFLRDILLADDDPDERCISCGAEVDHYLGCPDDPNPDYEAETKAMETR